MINTLFINFSHTHTYIYYNYYLLELYLLHLITYIGLRIGKRPPWRTHYYTKWCWNCTELYYYYASALYSEWKTDEVWNNTDFKDYYYLYILYIIVIIIQPTMLFRRPSLRHIIPQKIGVVFTSFLQLLFRNRSRTMECASACHTQMYA